MATEYYIDVNGRKDGPHDLVTIMRRIRTKKITKETFIYVGDAASPERASSIRDIAFFFSGDKEAKPGIQHMPSLSELIAQGWQFIMENNIMTVAAGALLLASILITIPLVSIFGFANGLLASWVFIFLLNSLYLVYTLRLKRGQTVGLDFIEKKLSPVFLTLVLSSIVLALMIAGGFFLLAIPGIIVAIMYVFVPFLILDKGYGIAEAMSASRLLLQKNDRIYLGLTSTIVSLHLLCMALIIPIPLTLPILASALATLYEELLAA